MARQDQGLPRMKVIVSAVGGGGWHRASQRNGLEEFLEKNPGSAGQEIRAEKERFDPGQRFPPPPPP